MAGRKRLDFGANNPEPESSTIADDPVDHWNRAYAYSTGDSDDAPD